MATFRSPVAPISSAYLAQLGALPETRPVAVTRMTAAPTESSTSRCTS